MMTHTYTPIPMPTLDCLHKTYFFTFTGAFFWHACGDTRNLRTYITSERRVFLVETVVLQTVLWDIRAWSARFLVYCSNSNGKCYLIKNKLLFAFSYRLQKVITDWRYLKTWTTESDIRSSEQGSFISQRFITGVASYLVLSLIRLV